VCPPPPPPRRPPPRRRRRRRCIITTISSALAAASRSSSTSPTPAGRLRPPRTTWRPPPVSPRRVPSQQRAAALRTSPRSARATRYERTNERRIAFNASKTDRPRATFHLICVPEKVLANRFKSSGEFELRTFGHAAGDRWWSPHLGRRHVCLLPGVCFDGVSSQRGTPPSWQEDHGLPQPFHL
jgi:hypothetical protein